MSNSILDLLTQYEDKRNEIKKLEKRLERLSKQSEQVSDSVQNGYKRRLIIKGVDQNRINKIHRLEDIIQNRYDRLLEEQVKVEEFIDKINKSDVRQIFVHRYIDNMEWYQIADVMQLNGESTARMRHDRYIEKFLK